MSSPGAAVIGWFSAYRTQLPLLTQAPYSRPLVPSSPERISSRSSTVIARLRGSASLASSGK